MPASFAEVEQQVRMLTADERARLAEIVLESLQDSPLPDIEAAWHKEIESRVAAFDRGETQSHSAEEVFAEAKRLAR